MNSPILPALVASAAASALPATAQETTPQELFDQANAACARVQSARYTVESRPAGADRVVRARVVQSRGDVADAGFSPGLYRVEILPEPAENQDGDEQPPAAPRAGYSYDGRALTVAPGGDRDALVAAQPSHGDAFGLISAHLPRDCQMLCLPQFTSGALLDLDHMRVRGLTIAGEETIDGHPCTGLEIRTEFDGVGGKVEGRSTFWISTKDHLPRGVDLRNGTKRIAGLRTGGRLDAGEFVLSFLDRVPVRAARDRDLPGRGKLLAAGSAAPDFELKTPAGASFRLSEQRGRVVVIDFSASWCGPCRAAMPRLDRFARDAGSDVRVVCVDAYERGDATLEPFFEERRFAIDLLLDGSAVGEQYGVEMLPTMYVVDQRGNIAAVHVGASPEGLAETIRVIEELVAK